jgi:hypothetical protein
MARASEARPATSATTSSAAHSCRIRRTAERFHLLIMMSGLVVAQRSCQAEKTTLPALRQRRLHRARADVQIE